uniref:CCHC-type domain-containing protein n=1 Tax=Cannabis sativa TaxID=3483 RepID=A0A803QFJ4_CANSA
MIYSLSLHDNIDKFNEIIVELADINHKVDEERQVIILLRSLPIAYQEVKAAIKLKDFELQLEKESKKEEVYLARGRSAKKGSSKSKHHHYQSRSKSIEKESRKCYLCGRSGQLQRFCKNYKEQQGFNKSHKGDRKDNRQVTTGRIQLRLQKIVITT